MCISQNAISTWGKCRIVGKPIYRTKPKSQIAQAYPGQVTVVVLSISLVPSAAPRVLDAKGRFSRVRLAAMKLVLAR